MSEVIRVLLADDHPALRAGICKIMEGVPDIEIVGEAKDGKEVQRLTAALRPDVLLLDLRMPGPPPAEIAAWVGATCPETFILVLTAYDTDASLADMMEAGAVGLVTKEEPPETLLLHTARGTGRDALQPGTTDQGKPMAKRGMGTLGKLDRA
jgi:DNA-binding NarL/FixJ family response regulator